MKQYFEIAYTHRESGKQIRKQVCGIRLAQQLARELAMATGHRATITRVECPSRLWTVHVAYGNGEVRPVWSGLTKRECFMRWKRWNEEEMGCVLVMWPEWLKNPMPSPTARH